MPCLSDNDVIMDVDAERFGDIDDLAGHGDIGLGGGWIARGVIVHEDEGTCREFKRPFHHFTWINRRMIDRSGLLDLVGDETVLLVEKEHAELLNRPECHGRAAIVEHRAP